MAKINSDGSIEKITPAEITELYNWCQYVVVDGVVPQYEPMTVSAWHKTMNTQQSHRLLVTVTVLPIKIMMAIATAQKDELRKLRQDLSIAKGQHHLMIGDTVRTADVLEPRDFSEEIRRTRRTHAGGHITAIHDSHGVCFVVQHSDGVFSCYDPDELTRI